MCTQDTHPPNTTELKLSSQYGKSDIFNLNMLFKKNKKTKKKKKNKKKKTYKWFYQGNVTITKDSHPEVPNFIYLAIQNASSEDHDQTAWICRLIFFSSLWLIWFLCFCFDTLTELGAFMRTEFLCISLLSVASGPRVKLASCKSALTSPN